MASAQELLANPQSAAVMFHITKKAATQGGSVIEPILAICLNSSTILGVAEDDIETYCSTMFQEFAVNVVRTVAPRIAGPAILTALALPVVIVSLILCGFRLRKLVNLRGISLLLAVIGCLILVSAGLSASTTYIGSFRAAEMAGVFGMCLALTFVCIAGIMRYAQVISSTARRRVFSFSLNIFQLILGFVHIVLGIRIVAGSKVSPTTFPIWYVILGFIPLLMYILCGVFGFSWKLPLRTENPGMQLLRTLRIVNDGMMAVVMVISVFFLASYIALRNQYYGSSIMSLSITLIVAVENVFESVINAIRGDSLFHSDDNPTVLHDSSAADNSTVPPYSFQHGQSMNIQTDNVRGPRQPYSSDYDQYAPSPSAKTPADDYYYDTRGGVSYYDRSYI